MMRDRQPRQRNRPLFPVRHYYQTAGEGMTCPEDTVSARAWVASRRPRALGTFCGLAVSGYDAIVCGRGCLESAERQHGEASS